MRFPQPKDGRTDVAVYVVPLAASGDDESGDRGKALKTLRRYGYRIPRTYLYESRANDAYVQGREGLAATLVAELTVFLEPETRYTVHLPRTARGGWIIMLVSIMEYTRESSRRSCGTRWSSASSSSVCSSASCSGYTPLDGCSGSSPSMPCGTSDEGKLQVYPSSGR